MKNRLPQNCDEQKNTARHGHDARYSVSPLRLGFITEYNQGYRSCYREKVVVQQRHCERVYKRAAEANVLFRGRSGPDRLLFALTGKFTFSDDGAAKIPPNYGRDDCREVHRDVVEIVGLEPTTS